MNKTFENITFNNLDLLKYQPQINEINSICEQLKNDKSLMKAYKKFLKKKEGVNNEK